MLLIDHSSCLPISNMLIMNPKIQVRPALLTVQWDERTQWCAQPCPMDLDLTFHKLAINFRFLFEVPVIIMLVLLEFLNIGGKGLRARGLV